MVFPTTIEDAHPFESQGANSRVVFRSAPAQLIVIGLGPATVRKRAGSPFVEGLALKLRASPPHMHQLRVPAGFLDRSDSHEALHLTGRLKPLAARSHGRHQARGQSSPGAG